MDLAFQSPWTRFQTKENYFSTLNKTSGIFEQKSLEGNFLIGDFIADMARIALLFIATLAFVALANGMAAPEPAPKPILNMLKGMMGGMQKNIGKMMGGKGGKKGGFQMPDFGKMMGDMMNKKQQMMGRMMGMKQKMMKQITSKFSKFGGGGMKKGSGGWN